MSDMDQKRTLSAWCQKRTSLRVYDANAVGF